MVQPDILYPIDEAEFTHKPVSKMPFLRRQPRNLWTDLSDKEIEHSGLAIFKIDSKSLLNPFIETEEAALHGGQWLMRGPANDREGGKHKQVWNVDIECRLNGLRAIAIDEMLPFNETSAEAAIVFLNRLPAVRRPGVFLVNGNIRLLWDKPDGQQVGLQFRDKDKVQFVILQADGNDLGSLMGIKSSDAVLSMVMASDVFALIANA